MSHPYFNISSFKKYRDYHIRQLSFTTNVYAFLDISLYKIKRTISKTGTSTYTLIDAEKNKELYSVRISKVGNVLLSKKKFVNFSAFIYAIAIKYNWLKLKRTKTPLSSWVTHRTWAVREIMNKNGEKMYEIRNRFGQRMIIPKDIFNCSLNLPKSNYKIKSSFSEFIEKNMFDNRYLTKDEILKRQSINDLSKYYSVTTRTIHNWLKKLDEAIKDGRTATL